MAGEGGSGTGTGGGPAVPPDVDGQLVINELMAANALTMKDEAGAARPWIEIMNPTEVDIPVRGYGVTDDLAAPLKGIIGDVVVPAHGYLVVWLDGNPGAGPTHVAAYLSKAGGSVGLARPDGSFIDQLGYGAQETDLSAAREPDGAPTWAIEWHVSPGAPNPAGSGQAGTPAADPESVPTAGDPSDRILGYDQMPQFSLTIGAAEIQSLLTAPDIYVPATLTYEGRDYGPVGVHLKGMQSFEPIDRKPSLRINIDKFAPTAAFFGLKDLTLNNMHSDFSMMHERIAYWVARKAGVPGVARQSRAADGQRAELRPLHERRDRQEAHPVARFRQQHRLAVRGDRRRFPRRRTSRSTSWWPVRTIAACFRASRRR